MDPQVFNQIFSRSNNERQEIFDSNCKSVICTNMTVLMNLVRYTKKYPQLECFIDLCSKEEINKVNSIGLSALWIACIGVDVDTNVTTVYKLIEKGADVNLKRNDRASLFEYLSVKGNLELIKYFIDNGAKVNEPQGDDGYSILAKCLCQRKINIDVIKLLLSNGADSNMLNKNGDNILHYALDNECSSTDIIKLLVTDYSVNINCRSRYFTPLDYYLYDNNSCNIKIIKKLLKLGADPNILNSMNGNSLTTYLSNNNVTLEIINLLVEFGVDTHKVYKKGTMMHYYIRSRSMNCDTGIINRLLELGVDPNQVDDNNSNSLHHILNLKPLPDCVALIASLIKDINIINNLGFSVFDIAMKNSCEINIIKLLLELGADFNNGDYLFLACKQKNLELVKLLIEYKADVNKLVDGTTVLIHATSINCVEMVRLLLKVEGINPDILDVEGKCALEIAYNKHKNIEILKMLQPVTNRIILPNYVNELIKNLIEPKKITLNVPSCVICMDKLPVFCTVKCHHLVYCEDCFTEAHKLTKCPSCREVVNDYFRIFF
jgi:uncharacterized protein